VPPGPWPLGNSRSQKYYRTTTSGTQQEACGTGAIAETDKIARPGPYQGALNLLAIEMRKRAGLIYSGAATSLVANRQEVTADFRCTLRTAPKVIVVRTPRAGQWTVRVTACLPPPPS
jgi:hypothetical protein